MINTVISKSYQQVIPADIFQFEIFGMINNLIKINKSMGTSVFSSQNIAKFGGCIFSQFEVSEDSSLTEEMMRLSFTSFF